MMHPTTKSVTSGVIVALLAFLFMPGKFFRVGGQNADLVHALLAGGAFVAFEYGRSQMNSMNNTVAMNSAVANNVAVNNALANNAAVNNAVAMNNASVNNAVANNALAGNNVNL